MKSNRTFTFLTVALLFALFGVPAPVAKAATSVCGNTVTHTSSQSNTWATASWNSNIKTAEWSGFVKYTPNNSDCQVKVRFEFGRDAGNDLIDGLGHVDFRRSTTNISRAQWNPTDCYIVNNIPKVVDCDFTIQEDDDQKSYRVKLVTDNNAVPPTNSVMVKYSVFEWNGAGYLAVAPDCCGSYYFN